MDGNRIRSQRSTDFSYILDYSRIYSRNKVFPLEKILKEITPPNVAIAEEIKVRVAHMRTRYGWQIKFEIFKLNGVGRSCCHSHPVSELANKARICSINEIVDGVGIVGFASK